MKYAADWSATQERFKAWWAHTKVDGPLMHIVAKRNVPLPGFETVLEPTSAEDMHLNVDRIATLARNRMKTHILLADALPFLDCNMGPGSMSLYLGAEPEFAWDTVWYKECVEDWSTTPPFRYDPENPWWKRHLALITRLKELAQGEFLVTIPDIIENVDILSAMRGPQAFCYDMIDEPDLIHSFVNQVDDLYFTYYDAMYDIIKGTDGSSSYTAFNIWGPGKTAKVQCDFNAIMSPDQFREFVVPSLRKQCQQLDNSMFHLDGKDAARHIDALMEIDELDALQWTSGAGQPDAADPQWFPIWDKVKAAGKSLWVSIHDGEMKDCVAGADRMVKRYGADGLYLLFYGQMDETPARELVQYAKEKWR
ncbi:MAG: trimethylamine corrinoid protein 2 [Clostridia bacterium]